MSARAPSGSIGNGAHGTRTAVAKAGGKRRRRSAAVAGSDDSRRRNYRWCRLFADGGVTGAFMRKKQGVLGDLTERAGKMSARAGELISDVASSRTVKRAAGSALAAASSLLS